MPEVAGPVQILDGMGVVTALPTTKVVGDDAGLQVDNLATCSGGTEQVAVADVVVEQQLKACDVVQSEVHVVLDNLADMRVNNNMSSNEIFDDLEVRDTAVPEQNLDGKDADLDLSPEKVLFVDSTAEFLDSVADASASAGKQPQLDPSAAAVVLDSSVPVKIEVSEVTETNKGCRENSCPQTRNCTAL